MKALFLAVLMLASAARAADDAPLAVPLVPGFTCVPDKQRLNEGKSSAACANELADLKKGNVILPTAAFIGIVGGVAVVVAAVTYGVVRATGAK